MILSDINTHLPRQPMVTLAVSPLGMASLVSSWLQYRAPFVDVDTLTGYSDYDNGGSHDHCHHTLEWDIFAVNMFYHLACYSLL